MTKTGKLELIAAAGDEVPGAPGEATQTPGAKVVQVVDVTLDDFGRAFVLSEINAGDKPLRAVHQWSDGTRKLVYAERTAVVMQAGMMPDLKVQPPEKVTLDFDRSGRHLELFNESLNGRFINRRDEVTGRGARLYSPDTGWTELIPVSTGLKDGSNKIRIVLDIKQTAGPITRHQWLFRGRLGHFQENSPGVTEHDRIVVLSAGTK